MFSSRLKLDRPLEKPEICVMLCAVSWARVGVLDIVERGFSTHRMYTWGGNILEFKAKQLPLLLQDDWVPLCT